MNQNVDKLFESVMNGELVKENDVKYICAKVREIFVEEANVQRIDAPVTICGDVHGQFYDLKELFKSGGQCPDVNYLFLGNYVNRGHQSIETILLLYILKIQYPDRITLLRGNHESRIVTQVYGLYDECLRKYSALNVWRYITESFEYLTIAALIEDKIFCVHGGIAEDTKQLDDIRMMNRVQEIPSKGIMCELLWNDPSDEIQSGFQPNPRGVGKEFAQDVGKEFLQVNNLTNVVRAHQLFLEGHKSIWNNSFHTVWSAPNYCYRCGNIASILSVNDKLEFNWINFQAANEQIKGQQQKMQNTVPDYFL